MIDIKPSQRNTNKHTKDGMDLLENSINKVGVIESISVASDGTIISGHARFEHFEKQGKKPIEIHLKENEYPVIVTDIENNSKEYFEAQILANTTANKNFDLDIEMIEVIAEEFDIDIEEVGVEVVEVEDDTILEAEEDDFDATPPTIAKTVLGDLYEIGEHRLLCGDSTCGDTVGKLMNGEKADMVMTDPPYNVAYEGGTGLTIMNDEMDNDSFYTFLLLFYKAFADVTKDGGAWYVWHADSEGVNFRKAFQESGLLMKQCLIWVKNALVMGRQDYHWKHEPCLYGWKAGAAHYFTNDRTKTTVIEDKLDIKKLKKDELLKLLTEVMSDKTKTSVIHHDKPLKNGEHPTMKPILLLAPLIENSSKPKWIVGDPFLGSGSTMVASHQLKRKCYGMELDPKYCDVIVKRMLKLDDTLTVKRNGIDCTNEFKD